MPLHHLGNILQFLELQRELLASPQQLVPTERHDSNTELWSPLIVIEKETLKDQQLPIHLE